MKIIFCFVLFFNECLVRKTAKCLFCIFLVFWLFFFALLRSTVLGGRARSQDEWASTVASIYQGYWSGPMSFCKSTQTDDDSTSFSFRMESETKKWMGNALTARENRLIHGEGPLQSQNCFKKIKNKNKIINKKNNWFKNSINSPSSWSARFFFSELERKTRIDLNRRKLVGRDPCRPRVDEKPGMLIFRRWTSLSER